MRRPAHLDLEHTSRSRDVEMGGAAILVGAVARASFCCLPSTSDAGLVCARSSCPSASRPLAVGAGPGAVRHLGQPPRSATPAIVSWARGRCAGRGEVLISLAFPNPPVRPGRTPSISWRWVRCDGPDHTIAAISLIRPTRSTAARTGRLRVGDLPNLNSHHGSHQLQHDGPWRDAGTC